MRFTVSATAALMLMAAQAAAQTNTPVTATPLSPPGQSASAPAAAAPPAAAQVPSAPADSAMTPAPDAAAPAAPKQVSKSHGVPLQQRFDTANASHDGHLTKDQATAAKWGYITSHFSSIDKTHKGYVTVADIRAYAKTRHAAKAKTVAAAPVAAPAPATTN